MTRRPPEYEDVFELPLWAEIQKAPRPGETVEGALERLRRRTRRYAAAERFYRLRTENNVVRVQRVPKNVARKLGDWFMMPVGTRLLLKSKPTERDLKLAKKTAVYLSGRRDGRTVGTWLADLDEKGRLVAERYYDEFGNSHGVRLGRQASVSELWGGEWD